MGNKVIIVPAPIKILNPATKEPIKTNKNEELTLSFKEVIESLMNDERWVRNFVAVKAGLELTKQLEAGSDKVVLKEDHYNILKDTVENPTHVMSMQDGTTKLVNGYAWSSIVMTQIYPFLEAVLEAKDE